MGRSPGDRNVANIERLEIRRLIAAGVSPKGVATAVGRRLRAVFAVLADAGGLKPRRTGRSRLRLSPAEREEISCGLRAGESLRVIAQRLGRAPSTVSREVRANGGRRRYRAWRAELQRDRRARRPRTAKLARNPALRARVEALLALHWSPEQIAATLRREHPHEPEMQVGHETIYQSLFVQGRGALRRELAACLRTGRARRRPQGRARPSPQMRDMVMISERPAEVADRAVPGHWEGDLLIGAHNGSAIGTLVERRTRFVMLVALPHGHAAPEMRERLAERVLTLPEQLRRSLTWDQGREMAEHVAFSIDTGVAVYFCDPHSPWQRGSNENTNGLLRQYFPKGTDLAVHDQAHLDAVAAELNGRPRQTLDWVKPCEALAEIVAMTG
jgi:IS30 family transposase